VLFEHISKQKDAHYTDTTEHYRKLHYNDLSNARRC